MTLTVHTARISCSGPGRLDVTRKSAGPDGIAFAPSWRILGPMLRSRKRENGPAGALLWDEYVIDYTAEMRTSYRQQRAAWDALLARDEATLCCYCTDAQHCHRTVIAEILGKLGAEVHGERGPRGKRLLRAMLAAAEHEQTADEAEQELREDGVDVDAFVDGVRRAVDAQRNGNRP